MEHILSDEARKAIQGALKNNLLRKTPPKKDTLAYAAWWAIMFEVNYFKAPISSVMFMSDEQMKIKHEIALWWASLSPITRRVFESGLDSDRRALESMGVW
jgi:hypothetical protein